jgi:hypothetical protein
MDLNMTVHAGPVIGKSTLRIQRIMVPGEIRMALQTEKGLPNLQEVLPNGPMGIMAEEAILRHREVFEEEGTPFLGMAGVTIFVDRGGLQEGVSRRAVGFMAGRAGESLLPSAVG